MLIFPFEGVVAMSKARRIAEEAARAAAEVIVRRAGVTGAVRRKSSEIDLVTETDVEAGVAAVRRILDLDAAARFVVEEDEVLEITGARPGDLGCGEVWVIDPLDGTTSYAHGFPCYSVSIALLRDGRPCVGAVYDVPMRRLTSVEEGSGTSVDGSPVHCSSTGRLQDSLLVTGFPYDRGATLDRQLEVLAAMLRAPVHGIRRDGSAAVDLCHVATGRADGFWEFGLKPWDMAAGVIICREAGALVTGTDAGDWTVESTGVIAANPTLHPLITDVVTRLDRTG